MFSGGCFSPRADPSAVESGYLDDSSSCKVFIDHALNHMIDAARILIGDVEDELH